MPRGDQELMEIDQLARRFVDRELSTRALEDDRYPFTPWNDRAIATALELGLAVVPLPESHGGLPHGALAFAHVLEIMAAADASHALTLLTQTLARATLIDLAGSQSADAARRWSDPQDSTLLAYPLYDDPEEPQTDITAKRSGDGYVLSGTLSQVACLPVASLCIVPVRLTGPSAPLAFFLVPLSAPGVDRSEPVHTLGLHASPVADLTLSRVTLRAADRLGDKDAARRYAQTAERFRIGLTAISLGVLRGSFELAFEYAQQRKQAKKQIVQHHMVQEMLSDMLSIHQVGMLALASACADPECASPERSELIALQEVVTGLVTRCTTDGVQVLGGNGYMHDYGQEKRMRDAKQLQAVLGAPGTRRLRVIERALSRKAQA